MSSADDDIPGTSASAKDDKKHKRSKSRYSKSSPRSVTSKESKYTLSSPSPDRPNSAFPRRSPATLRDRVLLANANAVERALSVSNGELSDTATTTSSSSSTTTTSSTSSSSSSSSSPTTPTQCEGSDGNNPDMAKAKNSGIRKSKKKKTKKSRERRQSKDAVLIGFSGTFPNLSSTQSIDSESERQSSPGDLRAIGTSGLGIFPPEREEEQFVELEQQQDSLLTSKMVTETNLSPTTTIITTTTTTATTTSTTTATTITKLEQEEENSIEITTTTTTTTCTNPLTATTTTIPSPCPETETTDKPVLKPDQTDIINQEQQQQQQLQQEQQQQQESNIANAKVEKEEEDEQMEKTEIVKAAVGAKRLRKRSASCDKSQQSTGDGANEEPANVPTKVKRSKMSTWQSVRQNGRSKSSNAAINERDDVDVSQHPIVKRSRSEGNVALMEVDIVLKPQSQPQPQLQREEKIEEEKPTDQKENINNESEKNETVNHDKPDADAGKQEEGNEAKVVEESAIVKKSEQLSAHQSRRPPTPKMKPTDEFYRLPFAHGWKRELVLPSTDTHRRSGDVFFISPEGRKFRSREDIIPHLKDNLTIDHFCFQRVSQEVGPEYELVRRAVPVNSRNQPSFFSSTPPVSGKRVPKPKVPKGASPPPEGWTSTMAVKGNARAIASSNGSSNFTNNHGAGGSISRKRGSQSSTKQIAAKQQPSPPSKPPEQSQDSSFDNDADNEADAEDDDNGSGASLAEMSDQMEQPGQLPPAQLLSDNLALSPTTPRWQEIVVIGGRKAIAILDNPPRNPARRCPPVVSQAVIDDWNSKYDRLYNKRIAGPRKQNQSVIMESLGNMHNGCQILMAIMKTMTLKERANMSHVCKCWAMVSRDRSVWLSVTLRDTYISNWIICLRELARHRTRELDMMGMIWAKPELRLIGDLRLLKALRILRTDPTDAEFLHLVFKNLPQLLELRSICTSNNLNLMHLDGMQGLRVLRLHMIDPKAKINSLASLANLTQLTELCVRGATNLGKMEIRQLKALTRLEILVLGSCLDVDRVQLGQEVLPALKNLLHFRLENEHKIMAVFPIHDIMQGLAAAGQVKRLELVNVDVDEDFGQLLAKCKNVEELLLMPKCMHNTANMTNAVMQAVSDNAEQLKVLRMGLVAQLLSATNNLCKGKDKDVVPVRRPVPGIPANDHLNYCSEDCYETDHGQCVAYLPMERLESILHHMMPQAWLTVVKIAMRDTTKLQFLRRPDAGKHDQNQGHVPSPKSTAP